MTDRKQEKDATLYSCNQPGPAATACSIGLWSEAGPIVALVDRWRRIVLIRGRREPCIQSQFVENAGDSETASTVMIGGKGLMWENWLKRSAVETTCGPELTAKQTAPTPPTP